jgi:2-hydroxychromene-2-carboxylate isomerase
MRAAIVRTITLAITSPNLRALRRQAAQLWRRTSGRAPQVHYFHQHDDPYSHLAAALLGTLQQKYAVEWITHAVPAPEVSAAPEAELLRAWSVRDAQRLAQSLVLQKDTNKASALAAPSQQALTEGQRLRKKWGHYLGATFYFEGEWYWGIDRLHYLEQRLLEMGLARANDSCAPIVEPRALQYASVAGFSEGSVNKPVLHFYCSLRSPYTYLAAAQARALAAHYGAELRLRFVLPMVMRGLPVPLSKRLYILRDTKREAERLGVPFGCVVDPVGKPVEQGLALLHHAADLGNGSALLESFLQGVFAEGVDAGSSVGLEHIALRAGLTTSDIGAALADEGWRAVAEANREDMLARGIWGVPSFRVNDGPVLWGQDRLWMVEEDLISALHKNPG